MSATDEVDMPPRIFKFGTFDVSSQVFHKTAHSFAFVNLKPLLPGHILVSPLNPSHQLLASLSKDEIADLFSTVTRIQKTLKRLYKADAFNVAVQDGEAAGQSVKHVHVHVIPRVQDDAGSGDKVHEWLEGEEGDVGRHQREWVKDEDRRPRSEEVMVEEARWLETEMAKDGESQNKM